MAIRTKLVLILLGFIIIPMMVGIVALFSRMQEVVRDVRVLQLENIANLEKERVDAFFTERTGDIRLFQAYNVVRDCLPKITSRPQASNSTSYVAARKKLEDRLSSVRATFGYSDIMLTGPDGVIRVVSNESHKNLESGTHLSYLDARAFEAGRRGIYISNIRKGLSGYRMLLTAPLQDRSGIFIGEVVFEIDAGQVFELVHESTGLGTTGETFIGIPSGDEVMFINPFHPERNKSIRVRELFGGKVGKPMQNALRGRDGSGESVDYLGHDVLAAWRKVPSTEWGLVAKIDSAEAFAPVVRLKRLALAAELLVVLFCAVAAFLLSRNIVNPIMELKKGMEIVGSGNLEYKVGTGSNDEIGQLSREFDRMAENLMKTTASRDDLDREVSERKQAEEAIRQANAYNRSLLEASLDPLVTIGPDGKITDVNNASETVTGRTRDELVGTDFSEYFTNPEEARAGYQQVFREGYVIDYPLEVRGRDGRVTPVLYNASVYRDDSGSVIGVFAAARDITERKRNEEVLRSSVRLSEFSRNHSLDELISRALDEAESQTGSRIGFFHFVEDDVNMLKLQTWSTNTLQNMCSAEGKGQHYSVDKAGVWAEAVTQRKPLVHNDYASLPNRKGLPPGHAPVVRELVVPILRGGQVVAVIGVGNKPREYSAQDIDTVSRLANLTWDIILAKQAEEEVRKLNQELERRVVERTAKLAEINNELESFSYSVSHDLRAPLRHIQGFVEMLAKNAEASLDDKSRRYLNTISGSATRMGELIDDLLMFSRMGRAEMRMATVDLGLIAQTIIQEMRPETEGRDIEWKIDELPPAYCDPSMIRLVMVNLISNALKFTKNCPHAVIEIGSLPGGEAETTFFIRDNGAGFDMQYVDKLFGVFQRLHRTEEFEGTGIGLANVRRIITRHGGRTWAEGALDKGATIYFTLPGQVEAKGEQDERA